MVQLAAVQMACVMAYGLLLVAAACQDWRTMRIADSLPLSIIVAYAVWAACGLASGSLSFAALTVGSLGAGILFSAGMAAFAAGFLGGGDVKLLAAASLMAGPSRMADFLMVTALAGGLLGVAVLAGASRGRVVPLSEPEPGASTHSGRRVPYGPAIAAGGLWVATSLAIG
jgi:prepilin peptidase CpaA